MIQTYKSFLISVILNLSILCLSTSCHSDNEEIFHNTVSELKIETSTQGFLSEDTTNTRANTANGVTTFEIGDAIGLIAVKGASVISQCNNVKLTYSGGGRWRSATPLYDFGADNYIAYYPFNDNMSNKTSVDAIKSTFSIPTDQSTVANFKNSNLLTAQTTSSGGSLRFRFVPAFAMVQFHKPADFNGYCSTTNFTYSFHNKNNNSITFSSDLSFYNNSGTYQRIIKPSSATIIKVIYNIDGAIKLTYSNSVNIASGHYKTLVHKNTINRNLKVGDFAYRSKDNNLAFLPGDASICSDKDRCVGVIAYLGNLYGHNSHPHGAVLSKLSREDVTWHEACEVKKYEIQAPGGTSGWYFAGNREMAYVISGVQPSSDIPGILGIVLGEKLRPNLQAAGGDIRNLGKHGGGVFWTTYDNAGSGEYGKAQCVVGFDGTLDGKSWLLKGQRCRVQYLLAF